MLCLNKDLLGISSILNTVLELRKFYETQFCPGNYDDEIWRERWPCEQAPWRALVELMLEASQGCTGCYRHQDSFLKRLKFLLPRCFLKSSFKLGGQSGISKLGRVTLGVTLKTSLVVLVSQSCFVHTSFMVLERSKNSLFYLTSRYTLT